MKTTIVYIKNIDMYILEELRMRNYISDREYNDILNFINEYKEKNKDYIEIETNIEHNLTWENAYKSLFWIIKHLNINLFNSQVSLSMYKQFVKAIYNNKNSNNKEDYNKLENRDNSNNYYNDSSYNYL